jgi:DNA-binding transcriptional LysR family regulator
VATISNPITRVNLKLLQTFVLVAEHNSFRIVADLTHRSQSAVSSQIKQLELQLGIALLHRTTRSVRLTAAGEKLLATTQRALLDVSSALQEIQEEANEGGRVSVACSPSLSAAYLPPILTILEKEYPSIRISIRELPSREQFPAICGGDFDFGLGSSASESSLDFEPLIEDDYLAITSQDFLPGATSTVSFEELSTVPILLAAAPSVNRQVLEETARKQGVRLTPKYECMDRNTLVSMAEAGLGVAILPRLVACSHLKLAMRTLRIVDPAISRSVGIIRIRGQALSAPAERLAQLCAQLLPSSVAGQR